MARLRVISKEKAEDGSPVLSIKEHKFNRDKRKYRLAFAISLILNIILVLTTLLR